jgi:OOP family OmpA-OmpF porin
MRSALLAAACGTLGVADVAWIDLHLVPRLDPPPIAERPAPIVTAVAKVPPREPPRPEAKRVVLPFEFDTREPSEAVKEDLSEAVSTLRDDPSLVVLVDGHTDRMGAALYNERLSRERAEAIAEVLIARGVRADRIVVNGHGARRPVTTGNDAASLARNRRVELTFRRSP